MWFDSATEADQLQIRPRTGRSPGSLDAPLVQLSSAHRRTLPVGPAPSRATRRPPALELASLGPAALASAPSQGRRTLFALGSRASRTHTQRRHGRWQYSAAARPASTGREEVQTRVSARAGEGGVASRGEVRRRKEGGQTARERRCSSGRWLEAGRGRARAGRRTWLYSLPPSCAKTRCCLMSSCDTVGLALCTARTKSL